MVSYADVGGLGTKQGVPVPYDWVAPSLIPQVLPWLVILVLLMLKPNRCASAWWIWVPLVCVSGLVRAPASALEFLPSAQSGMFLELISALGFGLAAVWLLASYLAWKHRVLVFVGMLMAHGFFSSLAYVIRQSWEGVGVETLGMGVFLAGGVLIMGAGLTLAGLLCRGRYDLVRLSLWLLAALVVLWLLVVGPIFMIAIISSGGNIPVSGLLVFIAAAGGISFGLILPFLVLSFANDFYGERLKGLLHLGGSLAPPVIAPPSPPRPAVPEAAAA